MSAATPKHLRQWISLPGTSCDVRVGKGVIDAMGGILKGSIGKPRASALVSGASAPEDVVEAVRRQLTDDGFKVYPCTLPEGPAARTLDAVGAFAASLGEVGITSDDLICVVGDVDMLSAASFVTSSWCGGTQLAQVPLDLAACVEAATYPRGIDVGGLGEALATKPAAKHQFCDPDVLDLDPASPTCIYARSLMATSAIAESEAAFGRLWDRAELIADGDEETICAQLADTAKSRGRIVTSTSIAIKQSMTFGLTFLHAMRGLVDAEIPDGLLVAEGVRFLSRVSCGLDQLKVDDVLTMDELLELLDLPPIGCEVDPSEMVAALKAERFAHSNRFLLEMPRALGRVRLGTVDDDLLLEHATAWCASRAAL